MCVCMWTGIGPLCCGGTGLPRHFRMPRLGACQFILHAHMWTLTWSPPLCCSLMSSGLWNEELLAQWVKVQAHCYRMAVCLCGCACVSVGLAGRGCGIWLVPGLLWPQMAPGNLVLRACIWAAHLWSLWSAISAEQEKLGRSQKHTYTHTHSAMCSYMSWTIHCAKNIHQKYIYIYTSSQMVGKKSHKLTNDAFIWYSINCFVF